MRDHKELSTTFFPAPATAWAINQPKSVVSSTPAQNRRAALTVARNALDVEDCRGLLDMLGLELTGKEQP